MARRLAIAAAFELGGGLAGGGLACGRDARRAPSSFPSSARPDAAAARRPSRSRAALSPGQVRAVLAREGARLVGPPRRRGRDIVAIGRDDDGRRASDSPSTRSPARFWTSRCSSAARRRRTRDAGAGATARRRAAPLTRAAACAGRGSVRARAPPARRQSVAPRRASRPPAPTSEASRLDPADFALSPIKPLSVRAGAPKVEPLPQPMSAQKTGAERRPFLPRQSG